MKKKQKNITIKNNNQNNRKLFFWVLFSIAVALILMIIYSYHRINKIEKEGITISATIIDIKYNVRKGGITTRNIAHYTYIVNNKEYKHFIEIHSDDIKINDCYELKVIPSNPKMRNINLKKKVECQ